MVRTELVEADGLRIRVRVTGSGQPLLLLNGIGCRLETWAPLERLLQPNSALVARSLEIFILGSRLRLDSLLEVRETIEPASAALAASRRTDAELAELERLTAGLEEAFDDVKAFLVANVNWHVAIARMSHNELLAGFMEALARAILAGTDIADFNSDESRRDALGAHRRIQQAIQVQDPEGARRRMVRHIQAYDAAVMRTAYPAVVGVR